MLFKNDFQQVSDLELHINPGGLKLRQLARSGVGKVGSITVSKSCFLRANV